MRILERLTGGKDRPTESEIAVARLLLAGDDPRLAVLREQLESAPEIERQVNGSTFSVGPTYARGDLMFTFEVQRLVSPWVRLNDTRSGRDLEFRVLVVRGGFLKALEGRAVDGKPWPRDWEVDAGEIEAKRGDAPLLVLPSEGETLRAQKQARSRLESWLGLARIGAIETFPPPSDVAIGEREREVGVYPPSYRSFLEITDGFESQLLRVLGHRDSYPIDSIHLPGLLVAWDSDDTDDYVVVLALGGTDERVYRIDVHDKSSIPRSIADDFRAYLARRLKELDLAA